jgi:hypothetical protein
LAVWKEKVLPLNIVQYWFKIYQQFKLKTEKIDIALKEKFLAL